MVVFVRGRAARECVGVRGCVRHLARRGDKCAPSLPPAYRYTRPSRSPLSTRRCLTNTHSSLGVVVPTAVAAAAGRCCS